MAYHYSAPAPGYARYEDYPSSTPTTPSPEDAYDYYVPQYRTPLTSSNARTTAKRHHLRTTSYSTPTAAGWHSPAGYPSPGYYATMPEYTSPPRAKYDYVSGDFTHTKTKARRFSTSGHGAGDTYGSGSGTSKRRASMRSQNRHIYVDVTDEADDPEPSYTYIQPRTTAYTRTTRFYDLRPSRNADDGFYRNQQIPAYYERPAEPQPVRTRRRASTTTRPKSDPPKPSKPAKAAREATAADAAHYRIPAGYCLKNWDPSEEPILLLGSVFHADSLGKWIFDWTVYHYKPGTPITLMAGDLWVLLIKFSGKMARIKECLPHVKSRHNRELIRDFQISGERIWEKFRILLKTCEEFMWAAKREGSRGTLKMGNKSGVEFVKGMFGRDRQLESTEKLIASITLWAQRFEANCEDVIKLPRRHQTA